MRFMLLLLPPAAAVPTADGGRVVSLQGLGQVQGTAVAPGVDAWLGVPFARPPVGALRFAPALPPAAWRGVRDATAFGDSCFQCNGWHAPDPARANMSEDCLTLNVWRPRGARGLLPVLFFIHGGGMMKGSSNERWYDGTKLASYGTAVVISSNYRLGPLGFLASDELRRLYGSEYGTGAANGLNDQVVALRFAQRYAAAFGGDPAQVTLFGESAGGQSVCSLAASPKTAGLFSRVILESGPCVGPWGPGGVGDGLRWGALAAVSVGDRTVPAGNLSLRELRSVPAANISWPDTIGVEFNGFWADGDGGVIPVSPIETLRSPTGRPLEWIVGFNSKDGIAGVLTSNETWQALPKMNDSVDFTKQMTARWGTAFDSQPLFSAEEVGEIIERYDPSRFGGNTQFAYSQADADYSVICPTVQLAEELTNAGHSVWVYEFAAGAPACGDAAAYYAWPGCVPLPGSGLQGWASHATELDYVFGTEVGPSWGRRNGPSPLRPAPPPGEETSCPFSAAGRGTAAAMQQMWLRFARGAAPAAPRRWARYAPRAGAEVLRIGDGGATERLRGYKAGGDCGWWRRHTRTP